MRAAGFESGVNRLGAPAVSPLGAILYIADPGKVNVSRLGEVVGVPWSAYPADDGRSDWRSEYVKAVRDSAVMPTPRAAPRLVKVSAVARSARAALRS